MLKSVSVPSKRRIFWVSISGFLDHEFSRYPVDMKFKLFKMPGFVAHCLNCCFYVFTTQYPMVSHDGDPAIFSNLEHAIETKTFWLFIESFGLLGGFWFRNFCSGIRFGDAVTTTVSNKSLQNEISFGKAGTKFSFFIMVMHCFGPLNSIWPLWVTTSLISLHSWVIYTYI